MDLTAFEPYAPMATVTATIIAIVALFRPEITRLWQWCKGTLEFHPREGIIIGFTGFGPRFSLDGTLEAVSRNHFIRSMHIKIIRKHDKSEHYFSWDLWESPVIGKDSGHAIPAYPFQLNENTNIQGVFTFGDRETKARFYPKLLELPSAFNSFCSSNTIVPSNNSSLFHEFNNDINSQGLRLEVIDLIKKSFYWEQGTYTSEITIRTVRPKKSFKYSFEFALSQSESKNLEDNIMKILANTCGVTVLYNQIYPEVKNFQKY